MKGGARSGETRALTNPAAAGENIEVEAQGALVKTHRAREKARVWSRTEAPPDAKQLPFVSTRKTLSSAAG